MNPRYPIRELHKLASGSVLTDPTSYRTMYNGDFKVILANDDFARAVGICKFSTSIAIYTCERSGRAGRFEIYRADAKRRPERIPLDHPPPFCLALLAMSIAGERELDALRDVWSGGGEGFLPKPIFVDLSNGPETARAEVHRSLFDAIAGAFGSSAARILAFQRQYTAFRTVHDQLQNAFETVESFLARAQLPATWLAFACEPTGTSVGPQGDIIAPFRISQVLPLPSQGLTAVELHATPADPGAKGQLRVSVASREDDKILGEWGIPYGAVPDGWMFLDLPEIDIAPRQSVLLTATWNTRSGRPPRLSLTNLQPVPESRVCIAGDTKSQRSLALRLHIGLPGSRRIAHPFHIGVMRQPHIGGLGRRLAPSVLRRFAELDGAPGCEPLVRLIDESAAIELRPRNGGMTVAKIPDALPAKARRLTATIMTEDPRGPFVEYALLALGPHGPYKRVLTKGLFDGRRGGFSGWLSIHPNFATQLHLTIAEPAIRPLDLYLATRLAEGQAADFVQARWLEFVVDGFCEFSDTMNPLAVLRSERSTRTVMLRQFSAFALAIVIPVYKHSVLLGEAVISALNQETDFDLCIVIINDGCPMSETHQTCLDFVSGAPDRIYYIRRRNGGLSAARNTGIEYVLAAWETVQAIYFLDADNRLFPGALHRAYEILLQNPEVGWVYPNIDMFGQEWNSDYSGEYSVLRHLEENICEAGSLVRRAVFEKGARFDESMRLGFEDWDFWLGAIKLGFRGKHLENFGFRYRRRPESMLRNSERDRPEIHSYIRRKHEDLFRFDTLMELEHREAPRYGIYIHDAGHLSLTSDPAAEGRKLSVEEFQREYYRAKSMPSRYARPAFIAVADGLVRDQLLRYGLWRWLFWYFESLVDTHQFVYLTLGKSQQPDAIELREIPQTLRAHAHEVAGVLMVRTDLLDECLDDPADSWVMSLASASPQPETHLVELALPQQELVEFSANAAFLDLVRQMRDFGARQCLGGVWEWRVPSCGPKSRLFHVPRTVLGGSPVYPRLPKPGERQIGFLLPIAEFGGVEKAAYNLARVLRNRGWAPHLFVFGRQSCRPSADIVNIFSSLNFLCDSEVGNWDRENRFMGSHYTSWTAPERHERALGLLSGLDVVVNCHCAEAHALSAPLRRHGSKTIAWLHVTDLSELDRPKGHTYLTLGYEHAYDLVACCSQQLLDWCHAMGIPEGKLSLLWNAPSYDLPAAAVEEALASRRRRKPAPLRVLFLGRLDRQKGLDRLTATTRLSREAGLPIEWRLIGAPVIGDAGRQDLEQLSVEIEPPKLTAQELTECYSWADVVLIVSRWEGLPLTILEAMRLGAVVCATEVGAVVEAVLHNDTGFLLPHYGTGTIAREAVKILRSLCEDRDLLRRVSSAAAETARAWTWENSAKDFVEQLDRLTPG